MGKKLSNRRVVVFCDNKSVVEMVNRSSAGCPNSMMLIRLITLTSIKYNVRFLHVMSGARTMSWQISSQGIGS